MKHVLLTFLISISTIPSAFCQTGDEGAGMAWEDFMAVMMEETDEESIDEETMEQLYELYSNPIDLNTATQTDLEQVPFLSEEQVADILQYVRRNGPMLSLGELMMIRTLTKKEREMLRLFVKAEATQPFRYTPSLKKLLKYSNHKVVWRTDVPFYTKEGYKDVPAEVLIKSPNKVYRGDKFHHAFRYTFSASNRLRAGVQMEKDAGERGVDYVAGYVMLKDIGCVERAVAGCYRVSFGKGLAINSGMKFSKLMMLNTADRMDAGITPHSSINESGYFTGAAATLRLKQWQLSAFGSYRKEDGTYNSDSTGMSSLKTDGLHRTRLERSKKGNLAVSNLGGNIHWEHKELRLSATAVVTHFDMPLLPRHNTTASMYRLYNASGQDFMVGSLSYAYRFKTLFFSGETAVSHTEHQSGTASLNMLRWKVNPSNALTLIGRHYGAKFVSINGKAFGENSRVQNEQGLLMGWKSKSIRYTDLEAYVDAMYFPWFKQGVSASSYGYEGVIQALFSTHERWNLLARYRLKAKQKDFTYDFGTKAFTTLEYNTHQSLKLQLNYTLSPFITLRTSATGTQVSFGINPNEHGFAICENLRWQNPNTECRIDLGIAYFNTDTYNTRIYHYEPSLLYTFGSTSYYYKGIRTTLFASIPLIKHSLSINAKLGMTKYFNRSTISSGLEMIDANHREDLQVQLQYKF
ncbi:MAG: helix-hairpin-helix domain-containing protein [Bacteroidaceae bacterium]|nr:helix-hairpin-helix domain-containing protein [Bacteroidaceae bacterium]